MSEQPIRVLQFGLGPIGCAVARLVAQRPALRLVGGVDLDPDKVGNDLGLALGLPQRLEVPVVATLADAPPADVVLHTTHSHFAQFSEQILAILAAGCDVVSTAEELAYPWRDHSAEAARIDAAARRAGRTVLGTGVNPGFLMDTLPLQLTAICHRVEHIAVTRRINATIRRGPFQRKIGAGLSVAAFEAEMAAGRMGHVGLAESLAMVCDTLGWQLAHIESRVEPLLADRPLATPAVTVAPGAVCGLQQVARGYVAAPDGRREEVVALTFTAALDLADEGDTIVVTGLPDLTVQLHGTNGDLATASIVVNAIPRVVAAAPGLLTMRDLPLITAW